MCYSLTAIFSRVRGEIEYSDRLMGENKSPAPSLSGGEAADEGGAAQEGGRAGSGGLPGFGTFGCLGRGGQLGGSTPQQQRRRRTGTAVAEPLWGGAAVGEAGGEGVGRGYGGIMLVGLGHGGGGEPVGGGGPGASVDMTPILGDLPSSTAQRPPTRV